MMNSYFDHGSTGFYNQAVSEVHQAAYRFSNSLSLATPTGYQTSRSNSGTNDTSNNYVDAACKLYDQTSGLCQSGSIKAECGLTKDQNGFKTSDQSATWNTSSLRPPPSSACISGMPGADTIRGFDSSTSSACSRSAADAYVACYQSSQAASAVGAHTALYPWMGLSGNYSKLFYLAHHYNW